jgi:hypothetical protein
MMSPMELQIIPAASEHAYQELPSLLGEYIAWDSAQTRQHGLNVQALMEFQYATGSEEIRVVINHQWDACF